MRSPYIRLPLALLFVVPVFVAQSAVWALAGTIGRTPVALLSAFIACVLGAAAYALYARWVEHRRASELGGPGAVQELLSGALIGALLFSACIGILALLGAYRIDGTREWQVIVVPLGVSIAAAGIEEILFRGVIFRLLEESLGTWIALGLSAALFGAGHLMNPNATWIGVAAIVIEAGVMLAAAYILTRRLWLAIGIHAAWNFVQSGVFSVPTSGFALKGFFVGTVSGPRWLTGGDFGVEGSVIAVLLCLAVGISLLAMAWRRGRFVSPFWRRRDDRSTASPQPPLPASTPAA